MYNNCSTWRWPLMVAVQIRPEIFALVFVRPIRCQRLRRSGVPRDKTLAESRGICRKNGGNTWNIQGYSGNHGIKWDVANTNGGLDRFIWSTCVGVCNWYAATNLWYAMFFFIYIYIGMSSAFCSFRSGVNSDFWRSLHTHMLHVWYIYLHLGDF